MKSVNPATGEVVASFENADDATVERVIARAHGAFYEHRHTSFAERRAAMTRAAELLDRDNESLARLAVLEMGKTITSARQEVQKCALACRHFAEHAETYLAPQMLTQNASLRYLPLGPVLAVMPWNFPYWQVVRFAAPALMAGNVGILKPASSVPQCARALEQVFLEAGFAPGVFSALLVGSDKIAQIIADPRIAAVTLTGSEGAGISVGALAGKHLKPCVLELGGSDPFIVMPSADLDKAVKTAVTARNINNGQSCIAAKRFIVHEQIYAAFERQFVDAMAAVKVGDPMREDTDVGPLATEDGVKDIERQVEEARSAGARIVHGGKRIEGKGFYYAPTVIASIPKSAKIYREEVFGPVALLFAAADIDEAIAIANDSPFGLGSSVWTRDAREIERFSTDIDAGQTFVNMMVASDPKLPFGGVKRSGYGRELAALGIRSFTNQKTVVVA